MIIDRFPNSDAVSYLTHYLNYLEQKNFKYDRSFDEYGRQKFPEMYGEPVAENSENSCQSEFENKIFEYLYRKGVPEHLHTLIFSCFEGKISGVIFGPSPEGEHGLYFFKANLEHLEIAGDSIGFEFSKGDFYGEQITQANYEKTSELETYGGSSYKIEMRGILSGDTLTLKCHSEFYECYDSEMKFYLKN